MSVRKALSFALFMMALGVAVYVVVNSPAFRIDSIAVEGASRVDPGEIVRAVEFCLGRHVLAVPRREIEEICLSAFPWVKHVAVERGFPFSELRVFVEERIPHAYLVKEESLWYLDEDGVLIEPARLGNPDDRDLPFVTLASSLVEEAADLRTAVLWVRALDGSLEGWHLSEVHVASPGREMALYLVGPDEPDDRLRVEVLVGAPDISVTDKLGSLSAILQDAQENGLRLARVDLRFAGRPTVTLRK